MSGPLVTVTIVIHGSGVPDPADVAQIDNLTAKLKTSGEKLEAAKDATEK